MDRNLIIVIHFVLKRPPGGRGRGGGGGGGWHSRLDSMVQVGGGDWGPGGGGGENWHPLMYVYQCVRRVERGKVEWVVAVSRAHHNV